MYQQLGARDPVAATIGNGHGSDGIQVVARVGLRVSQRHTQRARADRRKQRGAVRRVISKFKNARRAHRRFSVRLKYQRRAELFHDDRSFDHRTAKPAG